MKHFLFFTGLALLIICGCSDPANKIAIDPRFESNPPDLTNVIINQIGDNLYNLELKLNPKAIGIPYHAIQVGDEKIVLRDDGKKGDLKKGDGFYTYQVKDQGEFIQSIYQRLAKVNKMMERNKNVYQFIGRHAVPVNTDEILQFEKNLLNKKTVIDLIIPPFLFDHSFDADSIFPDHSLLITDPGVLQDSTRTWIPCSFRGNPVGPWTFSTMMRNIAGETDVEFFAKQWISSWLRDTSINGDLVEKRTQIFDLIIKPWVLRSEGGLTLDDVTIDNYQTFAMDIMFAPFQLIAIVNRMDLGGVSRYGSNSSAGEGRFVFQALDNNCILLPFTLIFEFKLPVTTCRSIKQYARKWSELSTSTPGSQAFNDSLQVLTDKFATKNACDGFNCLNQLRTNEIALASPWELREFKLDSTLGLNHLNLSTVTQEPQKKYNRMATSSPADAVHLAILDTFIMTQESEIKQDKHFVPHNFGGLSFLGAKSQVEGGFWDAALVEPNRINNDTVRHHFSLNTCSGCHALETNTSFTHLISNGTSTMLSGFLNGDPASPDLLLHVPDAGGRGEDWAFNDLERRRQQLARLCSLSCGRPPSILDIIASLRQKNRITMVH